MRLRKHSILSSLSAIVLFFFLINAFSTIAYLDKHFISKNTFLVSYYNNKTDNKNSDNQIFKQYDAISEEICTSEDTFNNENTYFVWRIDDRNIFYISHFYNVFIIFATFCIILFLIESYLISKYPIPESFNHSFVPIRAPPLV